MERYIAFDIGDKRIGVAVSDPFNTYALPSFTYHRKNFKEDIAALIKTAEEKGATVIVCGLPVNFDGSTSVQTQKTERFIEELKRQSKLPVVLEDERFTTQMAHETLIAEGKRREERKNFVDALAAANILDGYLQRQKATLPSPETSNNSEVKNMDENNVPENEEEEAIIELVDEDGKVIKFRQLDVTEYKGKQYVLLLPAEETDEIPDDEVVILGYDGKENLETVDDEKLLNEIFEAWQNEEDEDN